MKKTYTSLTSSDPHANHLRGDYELPSFIDMAPLEAALRGLCALLRLVVAQGGRPGHVHKVSLKVRQAVKALIAAGHHNIRADRKLSMLASPEWRARVLRDLGGQAALARWERIMAKRRAAVDALFYNGPFKPRPRPSEAQLIARAVNLKKAKLALFRAGFQKKCREKFKYRSFDMPNPHAFVDRVKVDQEGEFRLAPLRRVGPKPALKERAVHKSGAAEEPRPKIQYTPLDPIALYPAEFYAAERVETEMVA